MADDLLDGESLAKLPALVPAANEKEVKRSEVYCSKIIHQKASHQSRFTWTPLYKRIMEYNGHDGKGPGPFPRPLRSPFPCYACHRVFNCPPIFIPIIVLNGSRTEWGNFCDPCCANTYLHTCMNDSNLAARVADLYEYVQDVHGFRGERIHHAPHFSMRAAYGGDLTDEEFDVVARTPGLRTFERMAPFIPTEVVIEWQCRMDDVETVEEVAAAPLPTVGVSAAGIMAAARPANMFGNRKGGAGNGTSSAAETLSKLIGYKPEAANHHHQWEVHGLRQPSLADIEKRLLNLPKPDEKEGLYALYWERHGQGAPLPDEVGAGATPKPMPPPALPASSASKSKRHKSGGSGSSAGSGGSGGSGSSSGAGGGGTGIFSNLSSMLVSTNKTN